MIVESTDLRNTVKPKAKYRSQLTQLVSILEVLLTKDDGVSISIVGRDAGLSHILLEDTLNKIQSSNLIEQSISGRFRKLVITRNGKLFLQTYKNFQAECDKLKIDLGVFG